ncbi:CaiB/BaiF CoA transferase family protein, partial [Pseudacidovorax intermedius]|uniref:CaiB/BaiF CoA transferase family protein n=1 Tax=Pseudacidovorax intermedius TaxID=433924 RepID=UPI0005BD6DEC
MGASLQGIRVLDLTNVLAGPFACHQLAHMGADVIKVESRQGGDLARQLGADPELNRRHMGVSFLAQNPGKRSITVDFKKPAGKEVLRRLVRSADVLVENFRPGVMQRLGLGYESLLAENPRLVYCAISGFGQDGPLRDLPAYDQIIQGMSGTMSITGAPDNAPYRVGYPMADTIGGMTAAFAIAAALADRQRTGGTFIDVSMLEAVMATMGWVVSNHLIAGRAPQPMGNDNFTASPSGTFRTADGLLNIAANKQEQFEALCRVVERPDLPQDPRFRERQGRLQHRAELKAQLEAALAARSTEAWWPLLNQAGVPAGPVYTVGEALAHPQVASRGMIGRFDDVPGVGRDIRVVRTGFKIDGQAPRVDTPPPTLGQHSGEI